MNIRIYTDGAVSNNGAVKNKGSFGLVILDPKDKILFEHAEIVENTTNNRMELAAIVKALEVIKVMDFTSCTIYSDSKYCVDGLNSWVHGWAKKGWVTASKDPVKNKDLWEKALNLKPSKGVKINWIKGHQNSNNWNDYIDNLIVTLRKNESNMEEVKSKYPIELEVPFVSNSEDFQITDGNVAKIKLYEDYFIYSHNYCADVTDENDMGIKETFNECNYQTVFAPKTEVASITAGNQHSNASFVHSITLSIRDGAEIIVPTETKKEAMKYLKILTSWRFNLVS